MKVSDKSGEPPRDRPRGPSPTDVPEVDVSLSIESILVAYDFSAGARRALERALDWSSERTDVTVVHVVDTDLARRLEEAGVCGREEAIARMRGEADRRFEELHAELGDRALETMVVEGVPFDEINRIARDLDCDLIVIGSRSRASADRVLFGSTAEQVLRASAHAVLCVP